MERIHGEKKTQKCSICDYTTAQKKHLNEHIISVHEEGKPQRKQNKDKENASSGRVLKVNKKQVVETKQSQKLVKNAIKNHKETRRQKMEKKTEKITLNTRSIRRNYIEVINILVCFYE